MTTKNAENTGLCQIHPTDDIRSLFERSATIRFGRRELIFFLLMYVSIRQGKAPIEAIMPEASRTPLYQLINDPFGTVLGCENVKKNVKMADFPLKEYIAA